MQIKQFNVKYYIHDDRIIFRFNTTDHCEYKFWLTRRITQLILKSAAQLFETEHVKSAPSIENVISEIKESDKSAIFSGAYEAGEQYPLGADAILVIDAKCEVMNIDGTDVFSLAFLLPGGGNINLKLNIPIMKKVILLLEAAFNQAKW